MQTKIIGSLLTNMDNMKYCTKLRPEMFTDVISCDCFKIIRSYYDLGKTVNIVDISQILEGSAYTKEELGAYFKVCMTSSFDSKGELKSAVSGLINAYKAKELYEICKTQSYKPNEIQNTLINLSSQVEAMLKDEKPKGKTLAEIAEQYQDYYGHEHPQGLRTGFYELDEILNGLYGGDITILGARPAVGKSALASQILTNVADKGKRVGYFNLEMTNQHILERIIARYSKISMLRLRKAIKFMEEERKAYDKAVAKLKDNKGLVIFTGSFTANDIKLNCKNQEFDLVIIDYLQLIKSERQYGNRASEVGDISKSIKAMAMELNVPVLALSQLNRSKSSTDEPEINDLRESGDIEQDASVVMLMWNLDNDGRRKGLKVEKNRQGELGKVALEFNGEEMKFETINHMSFENVERQAQSSNECPFD